MNMPTQPQMISVVIPVYNEEANVARAYSAIVAELDKQENINFEIIFTDNHSTDRTFEQLREIAATDSRVRVLRFSRNFGFNRSILTGYRFARGDAAIQIDCDLEDPPSVLIDFIRLWRSGHDVVVGIRAHRVEGKAMIFLRRTYYRLLNWISDVPHEIDGGDFRLIDRRILEQLKVIDDARPYLRGLTSELAKNQVGVTYLRNRREYGNSKFPLRQLAKLGFDGIFSYSTVPLRITTCVGIAAALFTGALIVFYVIDHLVSNSDRPAGFATTTVLILFGISLNAIFLGIIGEYIARIHDQVKSRPTVIIEKTLNADIAAAELVERVGEKWTSTK